VVYWKSRQESAAGLEHFGGVTIDRGYNIRCDWGLPADVTGFTSTPPHGRLQSCGKWVLQREQEVERIPDSGGSCDSAEPADYMPPLSLSLPPTASGTAWTPVMAVTEGW
jgi:hypothetical protein